MTDLHVGDIVTPLAAKNKDQDPRNDWALKNFSIGDTVTPDMSLAGNSFGGMDFVVKKAAEFCRTLGNPIVDVVRDQLIQIKFPDGMLAQYHKGFWVLAEKTKPAPDYSKQREMDFWRLSVREFRTKYNQKV